MGNREEDGRITRVASTTNVLLTQHGTWPYTCCCTHLLDNGRGTHNIGRCFGPTGNAVPSVADGFGNKQGPSHCLSHRVRVLSGPVRPEPLSTSMLDDTALRLVYLSLHFKFVFVLLPSLDSP